MRIHINRKYLGILIIGILFFTTAYFIVVDDCVETTLSYIETFNSITNKDQNMSSVANWPKGPISLNHLGADFKVNLPDGMGGRVLATAEGDFDGDGYPDFIGIHVTGYGYYDGQLVLIRNMFEDVDGDGIDDDDVIFQIDTGKIFETGVPAIYPALISGDFNGDGLLDFFLMQDTTPSYTDFRAHMFINTGTATEPDFSAHNMSPNLDFTSAFITAGIKITWGADHLVTVDIDQDGDVDILSICDDKVYVIRNPGAGNFDVSNFIISELNYDQNTGYTTGSAGAAIDAGDLDLDGDIDIICGSVENDDYLVLYTNDGTENFTRSDILIPDSNARGVTVLEIRDYNNDGRLDIFGATDRWRSGTKARMWYIANKSSGYEFVCLNNCDPILAPNYDVDSGKAMDYDLDGDMDIILYDGNDNGDFYLVRNESTDFYNLTGIAQSTNVATALDPDLHAVTKVRISNLIMNVDGGSSDGLTVDIYVSNNGTDWGLYQQFAGSDISTKTNLPYHTFLNYGTEVYWKAVFTATDDSIPGYDDASYESPQISEIKLDYVYVEKKEYSTTSNVIASFTDSSNKKTKLLIAGTFIFPGWQGQLRAYDITQISVPSSSATSIRTISRADLSSPTGRDIVASGVSILWDAGSLLAARSHADRTIYTGVPSGGSLVRMDFNSANLTTLEPLLQESNNDNLGLINFIRGEGRSWKLGDINHSNPTEIGPPFENANLKGNGYDAFLTTWKDRKKYVYVGANDGMLHCFDIETGEEHWAYIPYNLVPKLKNMYALDPDTQTRFFNRDNYVDGSPIIEDVFIDADGDGVKEWITILICGQGRGIGSTIAGGTTGNFYFALDITDPDDPKPLWEFTHSTMGETSSTPVVGQIHTQGEDIWAVFMGSGYDNISGQGQQGHNFYAINAEDGTLFWNFAISEIDTSNSWSNGENIICSIPGSPAFFDIDNDGFIDRIYIGDLEGRLWKVDTSILFEDTSSWTADKMYEDENNYPILTKPAVWKNPAQSSGLPRVYIGTGGNDLAPDDGLYSLVAIIDDSKNFRIEWFVGDAQELKISSKKDQGNLPAGEKLWADPKIVNSIIYFSSLYGSIESVDPCQNLQGPGKLYGRYVDVVTGSVPGGSALVDTSGVVQESLDLEIKTRSAITLGERQESNEGTRSQEIFIQEYNSTIQKLEQPRRAALRIKSWREVKRIIK